MFLPLVIGVICAILAIFYCLSNPLTLEKRDRISVVGIDFGGVRRREDGELVRDSARGGVWAVSSVQQRSGACVGCFRN